MVVEEIKLEQIIQNSLWSMLPFFSFLEHAKDALDLSKMQETTSQMENQKKIKVCDMYGSI